MAIVKTVNWEGGSNARYDVNQMTPEERALFDGEGRPLAGGMPGDGPDQWTDGLPGARGGGSPNDMGGGGGDLLASPYFQQARSAMEAQNAAQEAQTRETIRQLMISTGLVPEGFQDKLGVLDDITRALIQKNTDTGLSQMARLNEGYDDQKRSNINTLASRGLGRSGAKGFQMRRASLAFDRNKADLLSGISGKINASLGDLAQGQFGRQQSLAQFLAQLSQTFKFNNYQSQGNGGILPAPAPKPVDPLQGAISYWQGQQTNPTPTYVSPKTGQQWYGGVNGYESTPFRGKALDSLMG